MQGSRPGKAPDIVDDLRRFALFAELSPETAGRVAAVARRQAWPEGRFLFQRGDPGDRMYAVTSGRIRVSLASAQGRELVIRHVTAGGVLGELAMIDGQDRSADAVVVDAAETIVLDRQAFLGVASVRPDLGLALARHLSGLLRNTNFQLESIAIYDLKMRVIRFLMMSMHQSHGEVLPDSAVLRFGFSQADLSAILGASRPKVNRVLQDLAAAGAVRREGDGLRCFPDRLRDIAGDDLSEDADPGS